MTTRNADGRCFKEHGKTPDHRSRGAVGRSRFGLGAVFGVTGPGASDRPGQSSVGDARSAMEESCAPVRPLVRPRLQAPGQPRSPHADRPVGRVNGSEASCLQSGRNPPILRGDSSPGCCTHRFREEEPAFSSWVRRSIRRTPEWRWIARPEASVSWERGLRHGGTRGKANPSHWKRFSRITRSPGAGVIPPTSESVSTLATVRPPSTERMLSLPIVWVPRVTSNLVSGVMPSR